MDLEIIILTEVRQLSYDIIFMWNLTYTTNELTKKYRFTYIQNKLTATKGEKGGEWDKFLKIKNYFLNSMKLGHAFLSSLTFSALSL